MLNYIWFGLMTVALIVAAIKGTWGEATTPSVESVFQGATFGSPIGIISPL